MRERENPIRAARRAARGRRASRSDSGQALVEFALVVPLLLLLLVGIFEFARAWNVYQVETDAAREAARKLVVTPTAASVLTTDSIDAIVNTAFQRAGVVPTGVTWSADNCVHTNICSPQGEAGDNTTVTVTYPYSFVVLTKLMGLPAVTLKTTFVMRNE